MPSAERYQQFREQGLCGNCGKRKAMPGQSRCKHCRTAEAYRDLCMVADRRNRAVCVDCGMAPVSNGTARCALCRKLHRQRTRAYRLRKKEQEREQLSDRPHSDTGQTKAAAVVQC